MAKNEQIRIDVEASDDASKVLDEVADSAAALEDLSPEVEVTADTSTAESDLADVESKADELGRLTPEIEVTADTSAAESDLADVESEADALARADLEIVLKAKVSDATAALKALRGDLEQTEDKAIRTEAAVNDVGRKGGDLPQGNAIADLVGPLGDAEGAASTAAGAFEGLGDIGGGLAGKLGASEAAVTGITGAIGGIGLAVAGAAAAYTYFSGKADAARKKQEELTAATRDYQDALAEGDFTAAGEQLAAMFDDAFDAAENLNIPLSETVDYITGAADEMPTLTRAIADNEAAIADTAAAQDAYFKSTGYLNEALVDQQTEQLATRGQLAKTKAAVDSAAGSYDKTNGILDKQNKTTKDVARALRDQAAATETSADKQERLKRETEKLDAALGRLKDQLSFDRTLARFNEDFAEAFRKVKRGRELTSEEILSLKENVLDVAEFAKMTPAQIRALLRKVDRGDVAGVRNAVQAYMDTHTVETPAGIKLLPDAADDASNDAQNELDGWANAHGPVTIPTAYRPPAPGSLPRGGEVVPSMVAPPPAELVNVTMYLPRGYRELDAVAAGRRAARRSGGLYRRVHR